MNFSELGLFIIQGIQQAENDRVVRSDGVQKRRKPVDDCLLDLVTGEPSGNIDLSQECFGIDASLLSNSCQQVDVHPVAAVDDGDRFPLQHENGGNP